MRLNSLCRDIARTLGEKTYFTGLPCKMGHVAARHVSTRNCTACRARLDRQFRAAHPRYRKCADFRAREARSKRERYARNPAKHRADARQWKTGHPDQSRENGSKRRAIEKRAVPKWADRKAIAGIFKQARLTGQQVDHVVPLRSKLVCGLHCEANLEVIPASDNARKGNRHWPDMP